MQIRVGLKHAERSHAECLGIHYEALISVGRLVSIHQSLMFTLPKNCGNIKIEYHWPPKVLEIGSQLKAFRDGKIYLIQQKDRGWQWWGGRGEVWGRLSVLHGAGQKHRHCCVLWIQKLALRNPLPKAISALPRCLHTSQICLHMTTNEHEL